MRIGEVTRVNATQFTKIFQGTGTLESVRDILSANVDKFEARFTPVNFRFAAPNWNNVLTKTNTPAMSDEEFEGAIKALARETYETGSENSKKYSKLIQQYTAVVSPDRKAIYEESMKKTGGKMNAATSFFDSSGKMVLNYVPQSFSYHAIGTETEFARQRAFANIYNTELSRLKNGL